MSKNCYFSNVCQHGHWMSKLVGLSAGQYFDVKGAYISKFCSLRGINSINMFLTELYVRPFWKNLKNLQEILQ